MIKATIIFFALVLLLLLGYSCSEPFEDISPRKAILGKWKMTHIGTSRNSVIELNGNKDHLVFLTDTTYWHFDGHTGRYLYCRYALNDSMLIQYFYAVELGQVVDTVSIRYHYSFEGRNTMVWRIDALSMFDYSIFQRMK